MPFGALNRRSTESRLLHAERSSAFSRQRYLVAVVCVALAILARLPFASTLGLTVPLLTFFPAVVLSAWMGGFGPGIATTVLSAAAALYLFIEPQWSLRIDRPGDAVALALFVGLGTFISWLTGRFHEIQLREQRLRLTAEQTLASIGDAVITVDAQGRVSFLNAKAEQLTGWCVADARGKSIEQVFRIFREETDAPVENPALLALREGTVQGLANHTDLLDRSGEKRVPIDDSAAPIQADDGTVIGAVLVFRDISNRRSRERALAESREQLRATLESISDAIIRLDAEWRFTYINPAAENLLGRAANELIGRNHWEVYPEAVGTEVERQYHSVVRDQKPVHFENHYEPLQRWFELTAYPATAGGLAVYFRDISDRKRAEARAQEMEEQLRLLSEANVIGIVFCDVDGQVRDANDEYLRIIGYTREELEAGRVRWTDVTPPEWLELDRRKLAEAHEGGRCQPYEKEYTRPDGTRVPVYVGFVLFGPERRTAVAFVVDQTAQKRAEAALRESEASLHLALRASRMGAWTRDLASGRVVWSTELEQIFGLVPGSFGGTEQEFFSYIHPDDRDHVYQTIAEAIRKGTDYQVEFRFARSTGESGWMEGRGQAFYDETSKPVRLAGIGLDITARKEIERNLMESEARLRRTNEELRRFTYAASHDLKEPLRTVRVYVQMLERRYQNALDDGGRELIRFAVDGARRMEELIDALLEYSRAAERRGHRAPVHVEHALETSLKGLRASIDETAGIVTHGELPVVEADPLLLTQVLQNLVSNALKYRKRDTVPEVHISAFEEEGGGWGIAVSDNGEGIAREYHEKIFGVFQRLHGPDISGTGIGLATCKKIVEGWGGRIWVESEPGRGAKFMFTVPRPADRAFQTRETVA